MRVNRVGDQNQVVTVQYFTETGSATPGQDYTAISSGSNKTLAFNAGETLKTFAVTILNDSLVENTETVGLVLANPAGATWGACRSPAWRFWMTILPAQSNSAVPLIPSRKIQVPLR